MASGGEPRALGLQDAQDHECDVVVLGGLFLVGVYGGDEGLDGLLGRADAGAAEGSGEGLLAEVLAEQVLGLGGPVGVEAQAIAMLEREVLLAQAVTELMVGQKADRRPRDADGAGARQGGAGEEGRVVAGVEQGELAGRGSSTA